MLFNSLPFLIFLPSVFVLYWFVFKKSLLIQNIFLLVVSYVFYGWWDYRFLVLILASTLVDYFVGLLLAKFDNQAQRKLLLLASLIFNLGLLGLFKYYHFFIDSWIDSFQFFGISMSYSTLQIILPVGISFYTFQTLSYTIDVYRKQLEPTKQFIQFAAYVSFFPQLVAGPIERAKSLLPQFNKARQFDYEFAKSGFHLIIWGLFKKMVVADNCAFFVNQIFDDPFSFNSIELFLGLVLFGIQIYGDFSGYSDIAIGTGRLFGFQLMTNFKFPYFSRDIAEFWRRWHISLTTWFRDYLYIPLGGSRGSKWQQIRNIFIIFLVSGFWHGANWTFLVWGGIHASFFLPLLLLHKNRIYGWENRFKANHIFSMLSTFILVTLTWVFFRADTITEALNYLQGIFNLNGFALKVFYKSSKTLLFSLIILIIIIMMFLFEFKAFKKQFEEVKLNTFWVICIVMTIMFMGVFKSPADFIYFQF